MTTFLKTFARDESGASAAEYALILAIVGSAIALGAIALGDQIEIALDTATDNVATANGATAPAAP